MFGFGSRNPQMRSFRFALLAVLLIAGVAFHDSGPVYTTLRVAYYAVILGVIGFALWKRSTSRHGTTSAADGPPGTAVPGDPASPVPPPRNPGWYPDQNDMAVQRHWDGSGWTGTRRWQDDRWVEG
jgi:hypothetical protein